MPMGLFALLEPARPYHLGPIGGVLALLGTVRLVLRPRLVPLALLIGWPLLVMGFQAGDVIQNTRHALALLPPVAILAAAGVDLLADWIGALPRAVRRPAGGVLAVVVTAALVASAVGAWRLTEGFIARFQRDERVLADLVARVPLDDRLVAFGATLALRFSGRDVIELADLSPEGARTLPGDGRPTWLLLPDEDVATRWADEPVGRAFLAMRDGPGLEPAGAAGAWTLWRLGMAPAASSGAP
jgi:hypothetical protein